MITFIFVAAHISYKWTIKNSKQFFDINYIMSDPENSDDIKGCGPKFWENTLFLVH